MNKKKQNSIDWVFLSGFFHFTLNRWIIGVSTTILMAVFIYFFTIPAIHIFPSGHDYKIGFYNDSPNGGNSEIIRQSVSDTTIDLEFILKEGFLSPYVGLSITPQKENEINLSRYNQIGLTIEGEGTENIGVSIFTLDANKKLAANSPDLCFQANLKIESKRKQYDISLNQFIIPDWWSDIYNISRDEKMSHYLKHVLHINIGTAYSPTINGNRLLRIHSISFQRNNSALALLFIAIEIILIFVLMIVYHFRTKSRKSAVPVTIAYKPVDIENESQHLKGFLNYINNHFHDHELTLEQVSERTGINQRRIANSIQQTFGCNFKTYINQIRINESKRLLKESELNMGEIAFKVGFSNQTHFNRVFKSAEGISPSEFRGSK